MSFVANQSNQIAFNDRYANLTEREKKAIEKSWARPFAEIIFPAIREERFAELYSANNATRPNTPVNIIIGAMILKEMLGLSDDDVVTGLMFDVRMQYALHTTSYKEQPLSDRTFSRFRQRLYEYEEKTGIDLAKEEILSLSAEITKLMKLTPHMKRMDSLMIASACKNMTRLEVVYATVSKLVNAVDLALGRELLVGMEHYLNADDKNRVIYHNKAEERAEKIQAIIEDGAKLVESLGEIGAELPEYALVIRLLEDQSVIDESGKRVAKENRSISPGSMQNPSDPEATYRKKAGKHHIGYVANVVETFDGNGNSVITDYEFEQNRHSDSEFCKSAINTVSESGEATPDEKVVMIGDGAFASTENSALAEANNIILVTTAMAGPKPPEIIAGFVIDKENKSVLQCPAGNVPIRQSYNEKTGSYRVVMEKEQCLGCPHREECNARMQAKSAVVSVSENKIERAKIANNGSVSEEEYKQYRNARNAIEGIPSVLRRTYDVDDMPVFGAQKSKLLFGFKIAAINTKKLVKFIAEKAADLASELFPRDKCAQM